MAATITKIGVLGAGQMGRGIAQVAAQNERDVILADAKLELAEKGKEIIGAALKKLVDKGKLEEAARTATLERIHPVAALQDLGPSHMVIEAATENAELKCELFRQLDEATGDDALLASNTSSISITRLAAVTKQPAKVIFFTAVMPYLILFRPHYYA